MVLDPKINHPLMLDLNYSATISHSGDFNIDFSGDTTIVLPDKDTVLKHPMKMLRGLTHTVHRTRSEQKWNIIQTTRWLFVILKTG